jgi:SecD/SecF fusion protein
MPIIALLLFGGATLKDFAFALLIGVASGAYSSIFIASPVLTHWKEREPGYRARRARIEGELGHVPAYAGGAADVEPVTKRPQRTGRLTQPEPETVSAAEFEQMKRDLEIEQGLPARHTSTLSQRLARQAAEADAAAAPPKPAKQRGGGRRAPRGPAPDRVARGTPAGPAPRDTPPASAPAPRGAPAAPAPRGAPGAPAPRGAPAAPAPPKPAKRTGDGDGEGDGAPVMPAPDIAENEGVAPAQKPKGSSKARSRNRRHGRRR